MTDIKELPGFAQRFILHWGEMGTRWGINRTVAQIHALLFLSDRPLHAAEICERLGVARSNVSNSLRELQNWGIVRIVHLPGDRRDHFESMKDVYELFRTIAAERKKREIDPTLANLRECVAEAEESDREEPAIGIESAIENATIHARQQIEALLDFFELVSDFYNQMNRLPTGSAVAAVRMGDKIAKTLGILKD